MVTTNKYKLTRREKLAHLQIWNIVALSADTAVLTCIANDYGYDSVYSRQIEGLGKENDVLKLDIDPKSHFAWTGGAQKILDKGRVSKYNKKFSNLRSKK